MPTLLPSCSGIVPRLFVKSPNETQLIKQKNNFFDFFALLLKAVSTNETALELSKEESACKTGHPCNHCANHFGAVLSKHGGGDLPR